jgi:hypothetical protein
MKMNLTKHDMKVGGIAVVGAVVVEHLGKYIYNRFFTEAGKAEAAAKAVKKAEEKKVAAEKKAEEAKKKKEATEAEALKEQLRKEEEAAKTKTA